MYLHSLSAAVQKYPIPKSTSPLVLLLPEFDGTARLILLSLIFTLHAQTSNQNIRCLTQGHK